MQFKKLSKVQNCAKGKIMHSTKNARYKIMQRTKLCRVQNNAKSKILQSLNCAVCQIMQSAKLCMVEKSCKVTHYAKCKIMHGLK